MKTSLFVNALAVAILCTTGALAQSTESTAKDYSDSGGSSIPNERIELLIFNGTLIARPSGPVAIACCTTWNSSQGTTGCASFEGNSCPEDAPFEAYTTE